MKYSAASLADVADHFEKLAAAAEVRLGAAKVGQKRPTDEMKTLEREAQVWRMAAGIVRDTEIATPARVRNR